MRHRPSKIDQLDTKVREEISRLRIDHGYTLDQIVDHLKKMDVVVARASLGRHVKRLEDKVGSKIRELRVAAEAVRKSLDEGDSEKVGALNRELAHSILMRLQTMQNDEGDDVQFGPQEAMLIAKALDHLASAEKKDADRLLKVRQEVAKKTIKAIDAIDADLRKSSEKPDAAAILTRVREEVYGLYEDEPKK